MPFRRSKWSKATYALIQLATTSSRTTPAVKTSAATA
uniref:Secreted protein n=1 Tax=Angiostrongylus cantonensis TaxID=6313 RepID=A0A158P9S3_ANGCA